jgi:hypothetical protein
MLYPGLILCILGDVVPRVSQTCTQASAGRTLMCDSIHHHNVIHDFAYLFCIVS